MEKYLCWFAHRELYVPYETIIERMSDLTSSFNNVYRVINDSSYPYRSMTTNAIWMNQGYACECSSVDEEPNVVATRFFKLLKDFNEAL